MLDRQRLGKQRAEVVQILEALTGQRAPGGNPLHVGLPASVRIRNHPACRMWAGHTSLLVRYGEAVCKEWRLRGYRDATLARIQWYAALASECDAPVWLGDEKLHSNHRARLLAKNPSWYGQFGWQEQPTELNYWVM